MRGKITKYYYYLTLSIYVTDKVGDFVEVNSILTSEWRVKHPFTGRNTQQISNSNFIFEINFTVTMVFSNS